MTLSGFREAPRQGHLDCIKWLYGYLSKMHHAMICVYTDEMDCSDIPDYEYKWSRSVYGELSEDIPTDAPKPLGNFVTLTHYVDANLMHNVVTGTSVTGILHLLNKLPLTGTQRSNLLWKQLQTDLSLLQPIHVLNKSLISVIPFNNWESLSKKRATSLVTTSLL